MKAQIMWGIDLILIAVLGFVIFYKSKKNDRQ